MSWIVSILLVRYLYVTAHTILLVTRLNDVLCNGTFVLAEHVFYVAANFNTFLDGIVANLTLEIICLVIDMMLYIWCT